MEPARHAGSWAPGAVGLAGPAGRRELARGPRLRRSPSRARTARVPSRRRAGQRPAVRVGARAVRGRDQRQAGGRRRDVARLDRLPAALALLHLRRHVPRAGRRERDRRVARRRLVPRSARLARRVPQRLRQRPVVHRPARGAVRGRTGADHRHRRASGRHRQARSCATGNYDGERYDAREEQPGWSLPGFGDTGVDAGRRPPPRPGHAGGADRAAGPLHRGGAGREGAHLAERPARSSTSARTWWAGCGSGRAASAGRS